MLHRQTETDRVIQEIENDYELYTIFTKMVKGFRMERELFTDSQEFELYELTMYLYKRGEFAQSIKMKKVKWHFLLAAVLIDIRDDYEATLVPFGGQESVTNYRQGKYKDPYFQRDQDDDNII